MKRIFLSLVGLVMLTSCVSQTEYVSKKEFKLVKQEVKKTSYIAKQTAIGVSELKKAFKEVNNQLRKQNKINQQLFKQIEELKSKLSKISEKRKEKVAKEKKKIKIGVVITNFANFRSSPMLADNVKLILSRGSKVQILGKTGVWYKVKFGEEVGYMHKDVIAEI